MTTYTTLARNSEWGLAELENGFQGIEETEEDVQFLVKETLWRFAECLSSLGSDAYWSPRTSELIGPIDEDLDIDYEALRDEVMTGVWDDWCNGNLVREE